MHEHNPRRDAHDPEERELARIARALPGTGPSAQVDAKVLACARAATERPTSRRRLSVRWGMGASAAAVLVVGLLWHLQRPLPLDELAPLTAPASAPSPQTVPERHGEAGERARVASEPATDAAAPAAAMLSAPATELPPPESDEALPPDAWIERIRARLAAGHADDARRSLRRFVALHPDRPLPDDLRALAE